MTKQELNAMVVQSRSLGEQILALAGEERITINHLAALLTGTNMLLLCILSEVNKDVQTAN